MLFFLIPFSAKNNRISEVIDAPSVRELRILSWNIYMLPQAITLTDNAKRARCIGEFLRNGEFDIILFQEAFTAKNRSIIYKEIMDTYPYTYGPANNNQFDIRLNSGLWVVSKIPLRWIDAIEFRNSAGFDAFARKGALMLEGELNRLRFQIVNTHFHAGKYNNVRILQSRQLRSELLDVYKKEGVVQIVGGDFNVDKNDDASFSELIYELDARDYYSGHLCSYDKVTNDLAGGGDQGNSLIDHIFFRNHAFAGLHVIGRVLRVKKGWSERHHDLSDHYPVSATVSLLEEVTSVYAEYSMFSRN